MVPHDTRQVGNGTLRESDSYSFTSGSWEDLRVRTLPALWGQSTQAGSGFRIWGLGFRGVPNFTAWVPVFKV